MRLDGLDEGFVRRWLPVLDAEERTRAARFVFARHRVQFIAAHALTRALLGQVTGISPASLSFHAVGNGKPIVRTEARACDVSFNLSHTDGLVGLAAIARGGCDVGFDVEPIGRDVTLSVADRYFRPEETDWLASLPDGERKPGFLRLWTLKEAFIKATGQGLSQDLSAFWFEAMEARIHFTPALTERPEDWWFEQRIVDGAFLAAVGMRRPGVFPAATCWAMIPPAELLRGS